MYTIDDVQELLNKTLHGGDILFVVPPFSSYTPALGVHLLQNIAQQKGYKVEILYLDLLLASIIGFDLSTKLGGLDLFQYWSMLNERLFARKAYGLPALGHRPELITDEELSARGEREHISFFTRDNEANLDFFYEIEQTCFTFIDEVSKFIAKQSYQIIAYTVNLGQTNCSIALLNAIKELCPEVISIVGGANCKGDMSEGMISLSKHIDYVFSDESEDTFSTFLDNYKIANLPARQTIFTGKPTSNLDQMALPDYQSYITQFKTFLKDESLTPPYLFYETSRGCVWGKKSKCSFCSRVFDGIPVRHKSSETVLNDLQALHQLYPGKTIFVTDDHMPLPYYESLLPKLAALPDSPKVCYYLLSNVNLKQLIALKKANIDQINPGLEAMSTRLLKLLRKGTPGRNTLLFLRNARSVGIQTHWNFLWGIPKDTIDPYKNYLEILPLIHHFQPPVTFNRIHLERHSVYYEDPTSFGIENMQPYEVYHMIFPPWANLDKLAFAFMGEYPSESLEQKEVIEKIDAEINAWRGNWSSTLLVIEKHPKGYKIYDYRANIGKKEQHIIDESTAIDIMNPARYRPKTNRNLDWAIAQKLGIVLDEWYVPLIIAKPELLLEFEEKGAIPQSSTYVETLDLAIN
ncbi:hypothetical protein BKI52_39970 [marine bacterium AO1-C]|nr:hypothetical protein BKI52_39970 [marine bacterium AO1-C]